eukprot:EG_transcript_5053
MPPAPPPPNEARRVAALRQASILDTPPEAVYDALVDVVVATHSVPIAALVLVDSARAWCKSQRGLDVPLQECPRDKAFAAQVVSCGHSLSCMNAAEDPRSQEQPLVAGEPHGRFIAGAPIFMPGTDLCLGALCIMDLMPRALGGDHMEMLELQARLAGELIQRQAAAGENQGALLRAVNKLGRAIDEPLQGASKVVTQAADKAEPSLELQSAQSLLDTAARMVDRLLTFCTLQHGPMELVEREFSVRQCVEAVIGRFAVKAQAKQLAFGYMMDEDIEAKGDVDRIQQALHNVVGNAVRHTACGHVRVTVLAEDFPMLPGFLRLRFEVADSGDGMPQHIAAAAATSFAACRALGLEGGGLGLAITQALCEAMAGHLEVEVRPGRGTTCTLTITIPAKRVPPPTTLSHKRVLVVDPSGPEVAFLESHCMQLGLQVSHAPSLLAAEPTLQHSPPQYDAVLCTARALEGSTAPPGAVPVPWLVVGDGPAGADALPSWVRPFCTLPLPLLQTQLRDSLASLWPALAGAAGAAGKAEAAPLNVVVVEEDKLSRQVLVGLLKRLGCSVHAQHSSFHATRAAAARSYDVVFLQVHSSMDGLDAAQRILQQQPGAFIVGITSRPVEEVRGLCLGCGLQDVLAKPIRYEALAQVLKKYRANVSKDKDTPRRALPPRPPSWGNFHCHTEPVGGDEYSEATWSRHTEPARPTN